MSATVSSRENGSSTDQSIPHVILVVAFRACRIPLSEFDGFVGSVGFVEAGVVAGHVVDNLGRAEQTGD